jgi:hypothetical protein
MSYVTLRGRWCDITVLHVHAPTEDKSDDLYEELARVLDQFPQYHKTILLDFIENVRREDSLKPKIGNDSLHEVTSATSKNVIVKSTMFPYRNIHKYTWISPDGKTHNRQIM